MNRLIRHVGKSSSDIMSRLTLLGTVHTDPDGFIKLTRFLQWLEPDLILVELSPFARIFRKRHLHSFRKTFCTNIKDAAQRCGISVKDALRHPAIKAVGRQITYPFEYRAASSYMRKARAHLLLVDYSAFSMKWILTWPELITCQNLVSLLSMPRKSESLDDIYEAASYRIRENSSSSALELSEIYKDRDPLWDVRECFMAGQIKRAAHALMPQRPVYLGGWRHLTAGGKTPALRDLLEVGLQQCYLLDRSWSEATGISFSNRLPL